MPIADILRTSNADIEDVADVIDSLDSADNIGWLTVSEAWAYASSTTITVPSGAASRFQKGDKLKFTNSGTKYLYITTVADTLLTVTGGSDYSVANAAISDIYLSRAARPLGFPISFNFTPTITKVGGSGTLASTTISDFSFSMDGSRVHLQIYFRYDIDTNTITGLSATLPVPGKALAVGQITNALVMQDASSSETYCYGIVATGASSIQFYKAGNAALPVNANNAFILGAASYAY